MTELISLSPWLAAMGVLMILSGFFSASEAALFYLKPRDIREMASEKGGRLAAATLMQHPDRLLSAVLFWNLTINIVFFSISSICSIRLEKAGDHGATSALVFAIGSLLAMIFFSEMMPKSLAVLRPRQLAGALGTPLALAVRMVDPMMPVLQWIYIVSRRIIWPGFEEEPYLELGDVQRVIEHSGSDPEVIKQEQMVLQNVVDMSESRVEEWMRPRTHFVTYRPPVDLGQLRDMPPSGYLLVAEPGGEEIEKAIRLDNQFDLPAQNIENVAEPVLYLPWCSTIADAFQKMSFRRREVTVVVNEFGDTIGVLTIEDILDAVFSYAPGRSRRAYEKEPIVQVSTGVWRVPGLLNLRRLGKLFSVRLPEMASVTIGGVVHEILQENVRNGEGFRWGPLDVKVVRVSSRIGMLLEVRIVDPVEVDA